QTVRLTSAGASYAREIRDALHKISSASLNLRANPGGGTLNLGILPTFGTRWLAPRLPQFLAANPGITINLATRLSYFDFGAEALDAAIHFGQAEWPGAEMALLRSEQVIPACSPSLKREYRFRAADDLRRAPLLSISTRAQAWTRWFAMHDVAARAAQGMVFDQFATAAQAAMAGLGVALLPTFLIEEELASRKLVRAINLPMESPERYYLVWPSERAAYPPLRAFREWLIAVTAPDR
ncbi:MAG: LysR substrate-binding domain-containing protein, partial [Bradyrhizobium sp.]|nr:LysR substrate-binding domain-containing protein [Bradyrhizobium sp.]